MKDIEQYFYVLMLAVKSSCNVCSVMKPIQLRLLSRKVRFNRGLLFFVYTARSSFFDVNMGAVDSPDPLKESKEAVGEGSCPVLSGDTEAEAVRVTC